MEKLINREQLAGMNIHYLFYSLEYFLDAQKEAGFKTIELWPGTPHFFLSYIEYSDCKHVRKLLDERDLTVKVITPENCTYQYQFAAQEKEQFEKSMAYFKKALDAGDIGMKTGRKPGNVQGKCCLFWQNMPKQKISDWQWNLFVRRNPTLLLRYMM